MIHSIFFLFLFLLIAGGILRVYVIFLVMKRAGIKKRNSSSANKSNTATLK
jgi:hypothetical protein